MDGHPLEAAAAAHVVASSAPQSNGEAAHAGDAAHTAPTAAPVATANGLNGSTSTPSSVTAGGMASHAAAPVAAAAPLQAIAAPSSATATNPVSSPPTLATATTSAAPLASSAVPVISTQRLQLVDEHQKFNQDVSSSLKSWHLEDAGFNYDLCAVVGSQSTGKSTLLNKLFGTSFDVMKENDRKQTTKGIWMSRDQSLPILIMDVEGSDGRERGEDQDFERKSALFSMASAEVLMVNMWEHQVGLYQGANMGMLKTVFDVNLGLFQASKSKGHASRDKTLIFFVIRDHIPVTPMANLQNTLLADMARIWDSLTKPEGLETASMADFFDFEFASLPHKLLQPEQFDNEVAQLKTRFAQRGSASSLFKPEYHRRIPADGLPRYLEAIWEQVMTNKDLDLPTQQEMLAQFRCDEIASAAFASFAGTIRPFRKPVETGSVLETLGAEMGAHRSTALAQFDKDASRYHPEVYKRKRADLLDKLNTALSPLFLGQLKNLHKTILLLFKKSITDKLRGEGYDFSQVVSQERSKAERQFKGAATLMLLTDTDWTLDTEIEQFIQEIDAVAAQCRSEETIKMVAQIERTFKKAIAEPTEAALSKPNTQMWDRALSVFKVALDKAEGTYLTKAKQFDCTEEENSAALSALRRKSWLAFRAKIDEQTAGPVLMSRLRNIFEEGFRYDDQGIPRVWKPDDDIDGFFSKARNDTLALVPLFSKIEPSDASNVVTLPSTSEDEVHAAIVSRGEDEEFDFASTLDVFSETRRADIEARFRKEADAYYVEAKRSMVSSIAQVPVWIYAVMAALGWNEFVAVIRSPIYFTFMLLLIAAGFTVWKLHLSGPLISVSKAVGREVHRIADDQLRQHFSQPLPQPAMLREKAGDGYAASSMQKTPAQALANSSSVPPTAPADEFELKERRPKSSS